MASLPLRHEPLPLPSLESRDAVFDEREDSANLVRAVSKDARFATRGTELASLAEAVSTGGARQNVWRGVNLEQTFTPETTIRLAPRRRRRAAGLVGALAAIVVFLPVGWTWWSFRQATDAYSDLLGVQGGGGASFIQLWTTGFAGLLAEQFWLPNVAQGSASLILVSILLIVAERLFTRSADRADDDEHQECAAYLAQALNYAQITINSRSARDPLEGLDLIVETSQQLMRAHQQTREASEALKEAASNLELTSRNVVGDLETSASALLKSFQLSLDGVVESLRTAITDTAGALLGSVGGVTQTLEDSVVNASGALESSVTSAVNALNLSVDQVAQASTGMKEAANASTGAQQALADAASGIAANTRALDASLRQQLKEATDAISREVAAMGAAAGSLAQSTGGVGSSLDDHTSALQHQISELTQIRASLERITNRQSDDGDTALALSGG